MYPRNSASPPRIAIGAVIQISDGAVQSSGVSVVVRAEGGSETAGGGTISYGGTTNVVYYAPTQAETNYTAFVVTAYKTGCIPVSQTIVTSAESTAGIVRANDSSGNAIPTAAQNAAATRDVNNTSPAANSLGAAINSILAVFTGITSLAQWLGLIAGKQTGNSTARTELRATGVGSGTYSEATDSLEALADAGGGLTTQNITDIAEETALQVASVVTGITGSISQDAIANGGTLNLRLGDDYVTADGRQKSFTVDGVLGDWSAGTAKLRLASKGASAADITAATLNQVDTTITMTFDIPRAAFATLRPSDAGKWEIFIELASGTRFVTPIEGVLNLDAEIPAAA